MPRPSSTIDTEPSAWTVTWMLPAVAGHRLVDRVVHDLVDQVVQAARVGVADIHIGPEPDRLDPLELADAAGVVGLRCRRCRWPGLEPRGPGFPGRFRRSYSNPLRVHLGHAGSGTEPRLGSVWFRRRPGAAGGLSVRASSRRSAWRITVSPSTPASPCVASFTVRHGPNVPSSPDGRIDRADAEADVVNQSAGRVLAQRGQQCRFLKGCQLLEQRRVGHRHVQDTPADLADAWSGGTPARRPPRSRRPPAPSAPATARNHAWRTAHPGCRTAASGRDGSGSPCFLVSTPGRPGPRASLTM